MSLPLGEVDGAQVSHSIWVGGIKIRGQQLGGDKALALKEWLKDVANARWMISYLENIYMHMPSLYVGNTRSIVHRVNEHMSGTHGFGSRILKSAELNWSDLSLHWLEMPGASKQVLESVEFITQSLSVSAFSKRVG
jgi:predicted GIY-YIG superfamily endonuclease